jgi:tetratricopeptide (TPR) repeat protein
MALAFRDPEALRVIMASGLCPADVVARGATIAHVDGGVILSPDVPLTRAQLAKLREAGVKVDAVLPADVRTIRCWAEAIAPARVPVKETPALALFVVETGALVDLAAELVRLGCERIELLAGDRFGVARVIDPPTYTVVRGLDRERGMRVYAPDPPGQDAVWVELGYRHPLAQRLRAEPETLLLVSGSSWLSVPNRGWVGLDAALELAVPGERVAVSSAKLPARRRVVLRLASGRREPPSMWVLRSGGIAAIDRLLDYLPEDVVARLTFAVSTGADPLVVVRARGGGRHPPPDLALPAEEYAPLAHMPDVYAPAGSIVEPPLRRERLRLILGIGVGEVIWLAPTEGAKFRVERVADSAFAPLAEWADYVVSANAAALQPWIAASTFEFAPFVSSGLEWGAQGATSIEDEIARRKKPEVRPKPVIVQLPPEPTTPDPVVRINEPKPAQLAPKKQIEADRELAELEAAFIALDAPGDAPERLALFEGLGRAYAWRGRLHDAGRCFSRAAWEAPVAEAPARLQAWLDAELGKTTPALTLASAFKQKPPGPDLVRSVAIMAAAQAPVVAADPHRVTRWLDDHDEDLDSRTLWLSRLGLAKLVGGDPLALAQASDRILARLAGGLPVERELPAFLRFAGRTGALGNASGDQLSTALDELAVRVTNTKRTRSLTEAPIPFTNAYVAFLLAHGYARIGRHERARELVGEANQALAKVAGDPVHGYLIAAFTARIEQAIAGLPPETALPEALRAQLANLDRLARYKVDRLREASQILEPMEHVDAIERFSKKQKDSLGPEFTALRQIVDPAARAAAVERLVDEAIANDAERVRLLDGIFDVLFELPASRAVPILLRTHPVITSVLETHRAPLYAEALVVAGHFGRTELMPGLLDGLGGAIRRVDGVALQRVLQHSLRALRRIGLRNEIAQLLADAEQALPTAIRPDTLRARLALAAGLAYLGDSDRALLIFNQAREALNQSIKHTDRLELTRALALAYAQAPVTSALTGIAELASHLREMTDTFGTNTHYCLSVLHFVESLVLGITSDDLALGEAGRRFVEDDEHLIRRRLFRDLGGTS